MLEIKKYLNTGHVLLLSCALLYVVTISQSGIALPRLSPGVSMNVPGLTPTGTSLWQVLPVGVVVALTV
jgi:hypothetical protein